MEREEGEWPHVSRDHTENSPPPSRESTQAVGPPPTAALCSYQVALEPNPIKAGNAVIVSLLSYIVSSTRVTTERPANNNASQVYGNGFPPDCLQRSLKDPLLYECEAFSLLFYSIRRVFFCSLQALGFHFWNIEFHLLLLSFPRLLKLVAIFVRSPTPCSSPGHGEFGSVKALYHRQLFFLIKDNIGLGTKACQKMLPFAFPE